MMDYYDAVLGLIPLSVFGVSTTLIGIGFELFFAVSVGALCSLLLIGHAMFVRAPVDSRPTESSHQPAPQRSDASDAPMQAAD